MQLDVFVVGETEGFVVTPSGTTLPLDEVAALGPVRRAGRVDAGLVISDAHWPLVARDIDARGYGIVATDEAPTLLALLHGALREDPMQRIAA